MLKYLIISLILLQSLLGEAQELFPATGSASNLPKGVLRVKLNNEFYTDVSQTRIWQGYSFSFGMSPKIEISQVYNFSNHHDYLLPDDFITHNNNSKSLITQGYVNGRPYPFLFENLTLGIKYRFLSLNANHEHFRMACYLNLAGGNEPHSVAESNLMGDNSGASPGLIATYLKNRFAISLNAAAIFPHRYLQSDSNIILSYNNALTYSLSFGYLLLPHKYKTYKQTNVNIYAELIGESYGGMKSITNNGQAVNWYNVPSLNKGSYLEMRPSVQFIFLSNTRLDLSIAYLLMGQSYERSYPLYFLTIQHDFWL